MLLELCSHLDIITDVDYPQPQNLFVHTLSSPVCNTPLHKDTKSTALKWMTCTEYVNMHWVLGFFLTTHLS